MNYKNLKREPLLNAIECYEKMAISKGLPSINYYLESDATLSEKELNEASVNSKRIAIAIINKFEELLYLHDIKIPDEDRKDNNKVQACIYGKTYYNLEDEIINIVERNH